MDMTRMMDNPSIPLDRSLDMIPIQEEMDLEVASSNGDTDDDLLSNTGGDHNNTNSTTPEIARNETRMVNCSKFLVGVVILILASTMGVVTYQFVTNQEDTYYQKQFDNVARDIQASSILRGRAIFDNLEGVSVSLTIQALTSNMQWPFVVFPHFQVMGMISNSITGASTLAISPIVQAGQREEWENFTMAHSMEFLAEGHMYDEEVHPDFYVETRYYNETKVELPFPLQAWDEAPSMPFIWEFTPDFRPMPALPRSSFIPYWQMAPAIDYASPLINLDTNTQGNTTYFNRGVIEKQKPVLTTVISQSNYLAFTYDQRFSGNYAYIPHSYVYYPVFDTLTKDRQVVAILNAFLRWDQFFNNVLPEGEKPIVVVLSSSCQQTFTYELRGETAYYLGQGDLHDPVYTDLGKSSAFQELARLDDVDGFSCDYSMTIYPTAEWSEPYFTDNPKIYMAAVVSCFLLTTVVFIIYDCLVQKRNRTVMHTANRTSQIVSSLFPSNVRDRLMEEIEPEEKKPKQMSWPKASELARTFTSPSDELPSPRNSLNSLMTSERIFGSQPIADLFPDVTVMFADMVGFTAWASVRDPTQVFSLLETVYHAIDLVVKRRRVFKVETIGDCYVACAGLPVPRKDHALAMARLANDAQNKMTEVSHELESRLGPETSQLCMRIGLHSGPVTAGVLRGEKGRFQLFGDTMNVASRMESTGMARKVHMSKETADLIIAGGKGRWVVPREDKVFAKGKGELQTYFLSIKPESRGSLTETLSLAASLKDEEYEIETYSTQDASNRMRLLAALTPPADDVVGKTTRLVDWTVDILGRQLRQVVAHRMTRKSLFSIGSLDNTEKRPPQFKPRRGDLMDEVVDVLSLPKFDESLFKNYVDPETVELPAAVVDQLRELVSRIAKAYNNRNAFHSFEHAAHVIMSVTKMMTRIVNPIDISREKGPEYKFASTLHQYVNNC
ncbi:Receptor-type guanylate cyclase gcy [Seminavis robusta]|uniref:Receptor-type guanylate cyclase gcy n=1 Tax=Seminavis robusta TaxID=568900 RepID=A0A9N8HMD3_9STRA|nr:Receptor-type guanylate cyclase gcy [Seminavis robusta]|eukprot:Sro736_g195020.1 Receptor-type guanylate cyclase gcy (955) ;mRNA; r:24499-28346